MEFLKELIEVEGKTVARVVDDVFYSAIVFSDDTCLMLKAEAVGEDQARIEIENQPNIVEKFEVGAITEHQYCLALQKQREKNKEKDEARQRALYEELKKKFENE